MAEFAIFDADGVLLDSSPMWDSLPERYLRSIGKTPENGLSKTLNEMTVLQSAEFLRERYKIPKTPDEIAREITALTEKFYREEVTLKSGVRELLETLCKRKIPAAVATAGSAELAKFALERLGVWKCFSGIAECAVFGAKTKPDVYLAAAKLINAVPQKTAVFEDSLFALETAKQAGFLTAAVRDISEPRQDKLKQTADFYFESFEELSAVLRIFTILR